MATIQHVETKYYKLPLEGNLVDALHGKHDHFELIIAEVTMDNGVVGTGYTYTGGIGGVAIAKMIEIDLKPRVEGMEYDDPYAFCAYMNNAVHYVARGGIASFAISAIDIALWDAKLKTEGKALADVFGTRQQQVNTYHGGIDLSFTLEELKASIQTKLDEGHEAVKIKVGQANRADDIARVAAIRELIGPDRWFAVDANMVLSVEEAISFANAIEKYNIAWFEEPSNPDWYDGYREIGENTSIPIAMGENLHTKYEHTLAFDIGKVKEIIPDCSNICGITGFFEVAKLAQERGQKVNSHGMQELHQNVLGALENAGYVECHSFPIHLYCKDPIVVTGGKLTPSTKPGTGVVFDYEKLEACHVK